MAKKITRVSLEGYRPETNSTGRSGTAFRSDELLTPAEWLVYLKEALDALYRHEARKIYLSTNSGSYCLPFSVPLRAADIAEGEEFNG